MGIRLGGGDDDADAARNIVDGYSHLVRPDEMGLPPGTLDPGLLPPAVLELAQRAFGSGHLDPSARPSADEWFVALDGAMESTVPCDSKRYHAFSDHLPRCPWCARVQAGSPDAFPLVDGPSAPTLQAASPSTPATKSPPQWLVVLVVFAVLLGLALVLVVGGR